MQFRSHFSYHGSLLMAMESKDVGKDGRAQPRAPPALAAGGGASAARLRKKAQDPERVLLEAICLSATVAECRYMFRALEDDGQRDERTSADLPKEFKQLPVKRKKLRDIPACTAFWVCPGIPADKQSLATQKSLELLAASADDTKLSAAAVNFCGGWMEATPFHYAADRSMELVCQKLVSRPLGVWMSW